MQNPIKIGVALSGGAFRGLAHIGVLQALEAHGYIPEIVAGTSMGAMVGGIYACGMDLKLIERFCYTLSEKDLIDLVVPREGFIDGKRIEMLTRTLTGNKTFEQTTKTFAAVVTDLNRGERVVLTQGQVYQAIRASISIPGIFKPYVIDGVKYVDGGVVDRLPITAARELGADLVIGVDVGYHGGEEPCGGIMDIIMHSLEVMEWQIMQKTLNNADLNVVVPVSHINAASMSQSQECVRIGREEMERRMPELDALVAQMTEKAE